MHDINMDFSFSWDSFFLTALTVLEFLTKLNLPVNKNLPFLSQSVCTCRISLICLLTS